MNTDQAATVFFDRAILSRLPIGLLVTDEDGVVSYANGPAAALIGADGPASLQGRALRDLFRAEDSAIVSAARRAVEAGIEERTWFTGRSSFNAMLHCDAYLTPILENGVRSLCIFLIDAHDQKALYDALSQTEKLSSLGEIVAGVAHELNNPLTGILGYTQLLLTREDDEKKKSRLEQISLEAQRCRKIVQSLLDFSRHYTSTKTTVDLNEVLSGVIELRAYQMRVDRVDVRVDLAQDLPRVEMDVQEMQRVFLNIINNAHYALSSVNDRPRVFTVRTEAGDGEVRITFADNGPGIPEQDLPRIFEPFFTTKDIGEGTGLGLAVAYGVVREHGGRITAYSVLGRGAEFVITLPTARSTSKVG